MENKMWIWWVIVIVVVVSVIFFSFSNQKQEAGPNTQNTETNTEPESVQDINDVQTGIISTASISYANALIKYADRRIQLDKICQAHPNNVTYKDNTGIMIDNRSPQTRTVKIGTTFTIKPYGFKIIVLPDVYLKTKTILVDCDGSQNVATILVQE